MNCNKERKRYIMLAVSGLSPQVITEALYGIIKQGKPVNEIHVITTREGKDAIHAQILASGQGAFFNFLRDYEIPEDAISFPPENIHVLEDQYGFPLEDIRTVEDNDLLIGKCMELAWRFTSDPETTVYFLIAGGRKTMSACLALAAQFYGRPQDRIYHVLVSPEFESCRDFFYPPSTHRDITVKNKDGKICTMNTRFAQVDLISMPFVSIRQYLAREELDAPRHPSELLAALISDAVECVSINLHDCTITFGNRQVDVTPALLAVYVTLARRRKECGCKSEHDTCEKCFREAGELAVDKLREEYFERLKHQSPYIPYHVKESRVELSGENIRAYISKLNNTIEQAFGAKITTRLRVDAIQGSNFKRYGLRLRPERIEILG